MKLPDNYESMTEAEFDAWISKQTPEDLAKLANESTIDYIEALSTSDLRDCLYDEWKYEPDDPGVAEEVKDIWRAERS